MMATHSRGDENATEAERAEAMLLGVRLYQYHSNHQNIHKWVVGDKNLRTITSPCHTPRQALDEYIDYQYSLGTRIG